MGEKIRFSPKQVKVLTWWQRNEWEAIICDGAVRSGKTFAMGVSFFLWSMRCFDGKQFGLCGKTIGSLRRNLLAELVPYLRRLGMNIRERRTENLLVVRYRGRENRFLLFGGRDESSAALIQGSTLAGVLLDETALMPRSFVEQAIARCSVSGSRLWFNCNPEGPGHWFYQEWIQKAEERRVLRLHFVMEDNPALTPRIRARYQRAYSGVFYRRFVLGEWTAAQGLVYDFFEPERDAGEVPIGPFEEWRVSVDYGTANPASFGLWGRQSGIWYRTAEYYYDSRKAGRQKTDAEYADDLQNLILNFIFLSSGVGASSMFVPLVCALAFPGKIDKRWVLAGVLVGSALTTVFGFWNILPFDSTSIGIFGNLFCCAMGAVSHKCRQKQLAE